MEVRLASHSDFITPSLACVKPMQIDKAKPNRVLHLEGLQDDEAFAATKPAVAKVTLNDCLACAGCITSAESVLVSQQSLGEFERMLSAVGTSYDVVVVSISAAARAAIAEHSGLGVLEAHGHISGFLKGLGCHSVLDCGTAANIGLLQQAAEFIERYRAHLPTGGGTPLPSAAAGHSPTTADGPVPKAPRLDDATCTAMPVTPPPPSPAAASGPCLAPSLAMTSRAASSSTAGALPLPLLSSSCPGWVCYAEKVCGSNLLRHLSRVKSPQQIAGTLVKYMHASSCGVPPERVCHVSVMPCFDKKLEASRDDFFNAAAGEHGCRDVDCVLSSGELLELLEQRGLESLAAAPPSPPDATPTLSSLVPTDGGFSTTYAAAGASGGHADFVFRAAALELFGVSYAADAPLPWVIGRNADIAELCLEVAGKAVLKFVRAYGFRNIQNIVRRVKGGKCAYHYVEMMACPGGCANGGGQPRPPPAEAMARTAKVEARYVQAGEACWRAPMSDPAVAALYSTGGFLEGGPAAPSAQQALLTSFKAIDADAQNPLTIQW